MTDTAKLQGKLTDSPWFWLCTFASVGVLALLAIGPKFRQREAQLESKYHMRQHVDRLHGQRGDAAAETPYQTEHEPLKTIDPLVWALTAAIAIGWGALYWSRRPAPPANSPAGSQ